MTLKEGGEGREEAGKVSVDKCFGVVLHACVSTWLCVSVSVYSAAFKSHTRSNNGAFAKWIPPLELRTQEYNEGHYLNAAI